MTSDLKTLQQNRNLISIRRENISRYHIQGFLLDYSDELILIRHVYDFTLDGLMVLRRSDISEIQSSRTDMLQTQMLKEEGIYSQIDFNIECDPTDWRSVFSTVASLNRLVTIEDENPEYPLFYLGEIRNIGAQSVSILGFSGAANWDDDVSEVYYKDISCVQTGNNYANMYERYFARNASTQSV